jgi:hypothetical protein
MAQDTVDQAHTYMTLGPTDNEVAIEYSFDGAAHSIVFTNRVSPDLVLVHQMRMGGFYRKLAAPVALTPTPRSVKDQIIRDTFTRQA